MSSICNPGARKIKVASRLVPRMHIMLGHNLARHMQYGE